MVAPNADSPTAIAELAAGRGLHVDPGHIRVVEAGLDYRVAFATSDDGDKWVLRIPRRGDVSEKIADEARILEFVKNRLTVAVPDWQIRSRDLIAYPLLPGEPGLTVNEAGEPDWHFDKDNHHYARALGRLIAEMHGLDTAAAHAAGIPTQSAEDVREEWRSRLDRVSAEFEINGDLLKQWRVWIDDDGMWSEYTAFTHGELYPAHLLLGKDCGIQSVLDWTTAKVGDPALDFMYHHMISTPETFNVALDAYTEVTGRQPRRLEERCAALVAAGPLTYAEYALTTGDPDNAAASVMLKP